MKSGFALVCVILAHLSFGVYSLQIVKIGRVILQCTSAACISSVFLLGSVEAADLGGNDTSNTKIKAGGASTLQRGIAKAITRGVNLDRSDFSGQNLRGVAFQQSIVRDCNFKGSNLFGASFFDATLDGSNFEDADMTQANLELAQLDRVNFKNTIAKEMYTVGTTNFEGISTIENSDWTDTELSKFQVRMFDYEVQNIQTHLF